MDVPVLPVAPTTRTVGLEGPVVIFDLGTWRHLRQDFITFANHWGFLTAAAD